MKENLIKLQSKEEIHTNWKTIEYSRLRHEILSEIETKIQKLKL